MRNAFVRNYYPHVLPRFFCPVAAKVLKPVWRDFTLEYWYLRDVALNIAAFMPYGFLLTLLLYGRVRLSAPKAAAISIGIGLSTSLLIELLQVYLPYRSSQMSDVITNTLGTGIGAMLFLVRNALRYRSVRRRF